MTPSGKMGDVPDVNEESAKSLFLELTAKGNSLGTATGFVVEMADRPFLVTNWHVLSGRDARTDELMSKRTGAVPDAVVISHNAAAGFGRVVDVIEPLYDPDADDRADGIPRWSSHPDGREVDVAVLPLTNLDGVSLMPYKLTRPGDNDVYMDVTSDVAVVGFPFGLTHAKKLGIWTRGTVATEYEVDYGDQPCFLIDARTRKGQSGSPVLYFTDDARAVRFRNPNAFMPKEGSFNQLLGVYSGRVNDESDLGFVWRPSAIASTLEAALAR